MSRSFQAVLLTAVAGGALSAGAGTARAATYLQTDLVSDLSALERQNYRLQSQESPRVSTFLPGSPIWVSDQEARLQALYNVTGGLNVAKNAGLPSSRHSAGRGAAEGPTGQVANGGSGVRRHRNWQFRSLHFRQFERSRFSAWNGSAGTTAVTERTTPGATYTRARH